MPDWFAQENLLALAPMADLTDQPFSQICREVSGKNFVIFREMMSAEAIVRGNAKTLTMAKFKRRERPLVLQIFGANPEIMTRAGQILVKKFRPDGLDVNMGCPVPKIAGKGRAGAFLMREYERAAAIISGLKRANLGVPVSVKTRLGWSRAEESAAWAEVLAEAGADAITFHGRTKVQGYSGTADWAAIARLVRRIQVPIVANGDIKTSADITRCREITGARGVMIGRAALGNPWIFSDREPDKKEFKKVIWRHARLHCSRYGARGIVTFRKHLLFYFHGRSRQFIEPPIKKIRAALAGVDSMEQLKKILSGL